MIRPKLNLQMTIQISRFSFDHLYCLGKNKNTSVSMNKVRRRFVVHTMFLYFILIVLLMKECLFIKFTKQQKIILM